MSKVFGYTKWDLATLAGEWVDLAAQLPLFNAQYDEVVGWWRLPRQTAPDLLLLMYSAGNQTTPTMNVSVVDAETGLVVGSSSVTSSASGGDAVSSFASSPTIMAIDDDNWYVLSVASPQALSALRVSYAAGSATFAEAALNLALGLPLVASETLRSRTCNSGMVLYIATTSTLADHNPSVYSVLLTSPWAAPVGSLVTTVDAPLVTGVNAPWKLRDVAIVEVNAKPRLLASVQKYSGVGVFSWEVMAFDNDAGVWTEVYSVDNDGVPVASFFRAQGGYNNESGISCRSTPHERGANTILMTHDSDIPVAFCFGPGEFHTLADVDAFDGASIVTDVTFQMTLDGVNVPQLAFEEDCGLDELCVGDYQPTVGRTTVRWL